MTEDAPTDSRVSTREAVALASAVAALQTFTASWVVGAVGGPEEIAGAFGAATLLLYSFSWACVSTGLNHRLWTRLGLPIDGGDRG